MASSKRDKALLAEITGVARRPPAARLSGTEQQEAAAALGQVAQGRADLLAEAAAWPSGARRAAGMRPGTCGPPSSASMRGPTSA